jgi:hypothetical protein
METDVTVVGFTTAEQQILDSFHYHRPSQAQQERIANIRRGYRALAVTVIRTMPGSADRTAALRQLHESMMTANKAIACEGVPEPLGT